MAKALDERSKKLKESSIGGTRKVYNIILSTSLLLRMFLQIVEIRIIEYFKQPSFILG